MSTVPPRREFPLCGSTETTNPFPQEFVLFPLCWKFLTCFVFCKNGVIQKKVFHFFCLCSSKYQMTLCQRPSVRRNTLPLVVSLFCGMVDNPPSGCFINHQHYRIAPAYVQTYVVSGVEKISSGFWWFYTCLGRGYFYRPILCLLPCNF